MNALQPRQSVMFLQVTDHALQHTVRATCLVATRGSQGRHAAPRPQYPCWRHDNKMSATAQYA